MTVENRVFQVLSNVLGVTQQQINLESSPETLEDWDSIKQIQIILGLEQEFSLRFSDEQMTQLGSAKEIVQTLNETGKA